MKLYVGKILIKILKVCFEYKLEGKSSALQETCTRKWIWIPFMRLAANNCSV